MPERVVPSLTEIDLRKDLTEEQKKAVFARVAWDAANDLFLDEPPDVETVEIYDFYHPRRNLLVHRPLMPDGPILVTQTPDPTDTSDSERLIYQDHVEWLIYSRERSSTFNEPVSLAGHFLMAGKMADPRRASEVKRELDQLPPQLRQLLGDHPFLM